MDNSGPAERARAYARRMIADDGLCATQPNCPSCGTVTRHRPGGEYWCATCSLIVLDLGFDL